MIDPSYLIYFKKQNNEDYIIASIILNYINTNKITSILDIGSGTGVISCSIKKTCKDCNSLTLVDASGLYEYLYPKNSKIIISKWEDCNIDEKYDLIIMSHILADFNCSDRDDLLIKATDQLSSKGVLIVVDNSDENEAFNSFVNPVFNEQGNDFEIDFNRLEKNITKNNLHYTKHDFLTILKLGETIDEAIISSNLFFPKIFSDKERIIIEKNIQSLDVSGAYAIPVNQRIYIINR